MAVLTVGSYGIDFDLLDLGALGQSSVFLASADTFILHASTQDALISGSEFVYAANGLPSGGMISALSASIDGNPVYSLTGLSVPTSMLLGWISGAANDSAKTTVLSGADSFIGSAVADRMRGYDGDDTAHGNAGDDYLDGGAGNDDLYGDDGNDTVVDGSGSNYLRGGAGDDSIVGGVDFDDAHGNLGNDTVHGGAGDDWAVGGQGNDMVFGDDGGDLCYGQLGDDTVDGGDGSDAVVGGQGNDSLSGGAGADVLSGDRGDDTISGGSGGDRFHISATSGIDKILDFNAAEGDHLQLDPGLTYTMTAAGADTIINVTGGAQVVLMGVSMSSITPDYFI